MLVVLIALVDASSSSPVVTLSHGGKLEGISYQFKDVRVDHFLSKYGDRGECRILSLIMKMYLCTQF